MVSLWRARHSRQHAFSSLRMVPASSLSLYRRTTLSPLPHHVHACPSFSSKKRAGTLPTYSTYRLPLPLCRTHRCLPPYTCLPACLHHAACRRRHCLPPLPHLCMVHGDRGLVQCVHIMEDGTPLTIHLWPFFRAYHSVPDNLPLLSYTLWLTGRTLSLLSSLPTMGDTQTAFYNIRMVP